MELSIWGIVFFSCVIHLGLWIWVWLGWSRRSSFPPQYPVKINQSKDPNRGISVIVAVRDEPEALNLLLADLGQQTWPRYEVIVVDDRSEMPLEVIVDKYPECIYHRVDHLPGNWSGKKYALTRGMALARYDHWVFTDADCRVTPHWLEGIVKSWPRGQDVWLGYSPYLPATTLLNLCIRYETVHTAFLYFGCALQGHPYMGVGRNLGFTRSWYDQTTGLATFSYRLSGSDDLLINHYARGDRTAVGLAPETFVYSQPETRWADWFHQKQRHASASTVYTPATRLFLGTVHLMQAVFYFGILLLLFYEDNSVFLLCIVAGYLLLKGITLYDVNRTLGERQLLPYFPILDLVYVFYTVGVIPFGLIQAPGLWKPKRKSHQNQKSTGN